MSGTLEYTVVIPVYNAERTIGRVIETALGMTPAPAEVIVVDDLSSDGSIAAAEAAGDKVQVIRLGGRNGAPIARNTGARAAKTPYLLMLDSDCCIESSGFTQAAEQLQNDGSIAGVMGVFSTSRPEGPFAGHFKNFYRHHEITEMRNPPPVFNSSCFLISTEAYMSIDGFDESFGRLPTEDNEFYFRLTAAGHTVPYSAAFTFVHDKPMGISRLFTEDMDRARGIILNMRGQLGENGGSAWTGAEKLRWAAEIFFGNFAVLMLALLPLVAIYTPFAPIAGALAALSVLIVTLINSKKLKSAVSNFGLFFAIKVVIYRIIEMVAAAVGIVRGVFAKGLPAE